MTLSVPGRVLDTLKNLSSSISMPPRTKIRSSWFYQVVVMAEDPVIFQARSQVFTHVKCN